MRLLSFEKLRPLVWLGLVCLFLGLFLRITWELHEDSGVDPLDENILISISKLRTPALNGVAVDLTALGSFTVITIISVLGIIFLLLNRDRWACLYLAVGSLGSGVGTLAIKHLFQRPRPMVVQRLVEVDGFSYPSGHSLSATSFYLLLMFLAWRRYPDVSSRALLFFCASLLIVSICFSRLYLGVHYPSDVVSGVFLGAAWACLLTGYFFRFERKRTQKVH
ncbi:MAG: phosphatase PAP2 family protein [Bdellovibrionales bacterium]|nr:phosphatase PAP2 family protein [Oligoflexia bacterium]